VSRQQQFVGEVVDYDKDTGLAHIDVKNKISLGDRLELIQPAGNQDLVIDYMEDLNGNPIEEAKGGGYQIRMRVPETMAERGLVARYIDDPVYT
jgi:putative protease